ncbi:MAG: hypothetical protein KAQ88_02465 [Hyphomicrobiaceae bacterium]|nr:hypothetical protein [Hyphomicrobiaceae bacterium]
MADVTTLQHLDDRFIGIYKAARARVVESQQRKALIVIHGDLLRLYHGDGLNQDFPGLETPIFNKMKTLGHITLAVYCLLSDWATERPIPENHLARISSYRAALGTLADELDTRAAVEQGILHKPTQIYAKSTALLDTVLARGCVSRDELKAFARDVCVDIGPVLMAAAQDQLRACHERVQHIRQNILSPEQWREICVLVLGPYMAREGELFLQYFARILDTPAQADRRLVYFEGDDLQSAFDRLGTTMLDAVASDAIFGDRERLHRDVLADATTRYLDELLRGNSTAA